MSGWKDNGAQTTNLWENNLKFDSNLSPYTKVNAK